LTARCSYPDPAGDSVSRTRRLLFLLSFFLWLLATRGQDGASQNGIMPLTRLLVATLALAVAALAGGRGPSPTLPAIHPGARSSFSAILMWHDVVADEKLVWFDITVKELEAQFREMERAKLKPVTLDVLADHLEKGTPIPPRAVVLTFDDNNLGLYEFLYPMLQRRRWPAVFFVHTDYVGVRTGKDHCTWGQLREMERSGLVRCYPHTASHPADLRKLPAARLTRELVEARRKMEKELGGSRPYFAYPEGHFDTRIAGEVLRAGYRLAITEEWGAAQRSPNRMMVNRYSMHRRAKQAIRDVARGR